MRRVGQSERIARRWVRNGAVVTSGGAIARLARTSAAGAVEYLQEDLESFGPAPHDLPLALEAGGEWFAAVVSLPAAAAGYVLREIGIHSDPTLPWLTAEYPVALYSIDDARAAAAGALAEALAARKIVRNEFLFDYSNPADPRLKVWEDGANPATDAPLFQWKLYDRNGAPATPTSGIFRSVPV